MSKLNENSVLSARVSIRQRSQMFAFLAASAVALLTAACSPGIQNRTSPTDGRIQTSASVVPLAGHILVTDAAGTPISGASVMIGLRENVPFPGNILTTDANGALVLPTEWTDAQPVTVEAAGFVRTTWMAQAPTALVLSLRKNIEPKRLELKGKTSGYKNLAKDGWADVGVIFPALRRDQLASLQISDIISPEIDSVTILGQTVEIPSNISIPKQEERYYFTITLEKPIYRTYLKEARTWKMVATHARFPFEEVVDDLRDGKSFFDVLNYFEFKSASVEDIAISTPTTTKDMSVTTTKFDAQLDVAAPKFAAKYTMLAVSVADNGGLLYPTDVKKLNSGETRRLVAPKGAPGLLVGALRDTAAPSSGPGADALSAVITPNNQTTRFEFLDIPGNPKFSTGLLVLSPPKTSVSTVTPVVTYATLNKIDQLSAGKSSIETKSPLWDVYSSGWSASMELPEFSSKLTGTNRWEVLFGGAPNGTKVQLGPNLIDGLTHISKSASNL